MHIRWLLGPAGSGKTHRCLAEIRAELRRDPAGPPLLLLAPKQSTFQLERQLLEDDSVAGWTRLQILSFERLARVILSVGPALDVLDEQGRVMVLRALLRWRQPELRVFRASARLAGFAQELSGTLRELQAHRLDPDALASLADGLPARGSLPDKLHDLALLLRAYRTWLREHGLHDADVLPDRATDVLNNGGASLEFEAAWLDGFAEMTPQEIELLAAVVRRSRTSTLAFCLDQEWDADAPWLSTWSVVSQAYRRCQARMATLPDAKVEVEVLGRGRGRFDGRPALAHLEQAWVRPIAATAAARDAASGSLRLVACSDFEAEAEMAAREVWRHVRSGGRFRDAAVMVRSLEPVHAALRRVFLRYEIPFFLDRRESLAHHPLAELTRYATRLAVSGWAHEDWFGALKTGLTAADAELVDGLENEALAHGWGAEVWLRPVDDLPFDLPGTRRAVHACVAPFAGFTRALSDEPDGTRLAGELKRLWSELKVEATLDQWAANESAAGGLAGLNARLHGSAWDQVQRWIADLERGFGPTRMPLAEWLPIIEAGLASLTTGVIPPSQDQVMIGAVDRSRQPELDLALVLGLNEGIFPAPPASDSILTDADREGLHSRGVLLGLDRLRRLGRERYLGYVACTRSRRRVVLSWSERDDAGRLLNPSPLVDRVRTIFPEVVVDSFDTESVAPGAPEAELAGRIEHRSELVPWLFARAHHTGLEKLAGEAVGRTWLRRRPPGLPEERVAPGLVSRLYGLEPEISVSALESLASCPFQFFVRHGLRGREREEFQVDRRHTGSLAHELLARFHESITGDGLRWRDLTPEQAHSRLDAVARRHLADFGGGLFASTPEARWEAESLVKTLRECVAVLVGWMANYRLDPLWAEVDFGGSSPRPAWRIQLPDRRALRIRGKADRVDVVRPKVGPPQMAVVDYKLRFRRLNEDRLRAGIDLQLAAYALALLEVVSWQETGASEIPVPAGFFYVGLSAPIDRPASRNKVETVGDLVVQRHRHRGVARAGSVPWLDQGFLQESSGQFGFRFTKGGTPYRGDDARPDDEFEALLRMVRRTIETLGEMLFAGDVTVRPYRDGTDTACKACDFRPICRFDPWTQPYRRLAPPVPPADKPPEAD